MVTFLMIPMREPNHERTELELKRLRSVNSTDSLRSPQAYHSAKFHPTLWLPLVTIKAL